MFENFKRTWNQLFQFGVWIAALITVLIFKPNLYEFKEDWLPNFLQFICVITSGLLLVLTRKFDEEKYIKFWWAIAVIAFLTTIGLAAIYTYDFDRYTAPYANSRTVVGEKADLTIQAKSRLGELESTVYKRPITIEELVGKAVKTETLWDPELLRHRRSILLAEYASFFFITTILIITLLQAIKKPSRS